MTRRFSQEDIFFLWQTACFHTSSDKPMRLMSYYGNARMVWLNRDTIEQESGIKLTDAERERLKNTEPDEVYDEVARELEKHNAYVMFITDNEYPVSLKEAKSRPNVLYIKGKIPSSDMQGVGVVGSRDCSIEGACAARAITRRIAAKGMVIVSGLARGIDTVAAECALESNNDFATIAVLGGGIDTAIIRENRELAERIAERGAVISQFGFGYRASNRTFPIRNEVISGLSDYIVVAEAGVKSGALITAKAHIKNGRKVYAIIGEGSGFEGCRELLRTGGAQRIDVNPTEDDLRIVKERMQRSGVQYKRNEQVKNGREGYAKSAGNGASKSKNGGRTAERKDEGNKELNKQNLQKNDNKSKEAPQKALDETEQLLYNLLIDGDKTVDELCHKSGIDISRLNLVLMQMEFSDLIEQLPGRTYRIKK